MKRLFCSVLVILALCLTLPLALTTGCTTNAQATAYKTIYSVEVSTTGAYDAFLDGVIHGIIPTNGVPQVSNAYNLFQQADQVAIAAAQFNNQAPPPNALLTNSANVFNAIGKAKNL